ncbi:hypothetical protein AQ913_22260 [Burkholderia pseudomallei]|uniref:hypothetical protein n=1 Tax=Burkholderia pseudomallei TaxID=28450 RepID=UPI000978857D|nr:hypothetical protein [Burkholderia pseudomallei]ONC17944.1 hypothetical protein AQ913_22260 [Burkholderia pseudomallei]
MNDQQQIRADALTDEHIATLKLAARAVTPQDIDGAERIESRPDGSYITCPACEGEGCIPFESDYCNYDHVAIGVQFYGVGTEPGAAEAYFRAAKPATILALLDRLERAESALAAPPVEQPAAAPADERAAFVKVIGYERPDTDGVAQDAWDSQRATWLEALEYARAAASPAAEAVALTDEGIIQLFEEKADVDLEVYHGIAASTVLSFARALLAAPQPAQAASPAAERVTDALQALSADVHTLGDGWANDEAMIGLAKKYLQVEPKPASPELSLWRDFVLLAVTDAAPQPAQAASPAAVIPAGWMLVPKHRGTKPLSELIIAASLACVENRLMDDDDRHELAQYADQLQHTPTVSLAEKPIAWVRKHLDTGELSGDWLWDDVIEQCRKDSGVWFPLGVLGARPALPEEPAAIHQVIHQVWVEETSSWADVTPAYYAERQPSNRRRVYYAPQPAQADAPAETRAKSISDEMMDLADRLGSEWKDVDPRAWQHLLVYAPAEAFPYQKTFNAIAAATSVEGGHVSISVKAFRDAFGGAVAEAREPIAWVTDDDRAITAAQKQRALADGGATASSVRPYSIPCYAVSAPADAGEARLTDAARDMLAERRRQVEAEGWTPEHDDQYQHGAIALAAACYAANAGGVAWADPLPSFWPWMHNWWKPTTPRRDLVKAGALILAELERLDRAALLNGADHDQ